MNYSKVLESVKLGEELSSSSYTLIRKKLCNEDFAVFDQLFKIAIGEDSGDIGLAQRIINLSPKYMTKASSIECFEKYINLFKENPKGKIGSQIYQMSTSIINNKVIPPSYKFEFFLQGYPSNGIIEKLNVQELDYFLDQFALEINHQWPLNSGCLTSILFESLKRSKISAFKSLNFCLTKQMELCRQNPNERYILEDLIKHILRSNLINHLDNDLFNECLSSWKQLENDTALKFQQNNHHQTKKRLDRLKEGYGLMKDLFRTSLSQRSDVLSQLDSMLMG